jgi:PBP1b-binding outer membrane lipoprotein LpoB
MKKELVTIIGIICILTGCQREEFESVKNVVNNLTNFEITVNEMPDDKTQTRGFSSADLSVDVDVFQLRLVL